MNVAACACVLIFVFNNQRVCSGPISFTVVVQDLARSDCEYHKNATGFSSKELVLDGSP